MTDHRRADGEPDALRLQDTVRLSSDGLAKVLGDLEARVMRVVWTIGRPAPAREVHEHVVREHDVAIHTVITVLNKLVTKGLLRREKLDDLLHYIALHTEQEFLAQASRRVVSGILSLGPEAVTASFVDELAETDPRQLEELSHLIQQRIRERGST